MPRKKAIESHKQTIGRISVYNAPATEGATQTIEKDSVSDINIPILADFAGVKETNNIPPTALSNRRIA